MTEQMRFFLFAGETYYPAGGARDYRGSYPTLNAALVAFDRRAGEAGWDWGHIAELTDSGQLVIVWRTDEEGYQP